MIAFVAVAAGLALFFAFSRPAKAGTTYTQVQASTGDAVDIWKDTSTGVLTFQWNGATDSLRFDPATSTTTEIDGTTVTAINTYPSSSVAWSNVDSEYGVTQSQVTNAIASGTTSAAPAAFSANASTQNVTTSPYITNVEYANNRSGLAAATGLTVPNLSSLDGYAFGDSGKEEGYGPNLATDGTEPTGSYTGTGDTGKVAVLWFGAFDSNGDVPIEVDIAAASSTNPTADGSIFQSMYNSSSYPHYYAPPSTHVCPTSPQPGPTKFVSYSKNSVQPATYCGVTVQYALTDDYDIVFQYGSEWVGVTTQTAPSFTEWTSIIQSIVTAPNS